MRSLILIAAAIVASPAAAGPTVPEKCRDDHARAAYPTMREARPRRLSEMPPATQLKAVDNRVDGCPRPVIVRRDVGASPAAPSRR